MDAVYRWSALVTLIGVMGISATFRRRARRASGTIPRARESTSLIMGRLALGLPLFGSVVLYLVNPNWMHWATLALPPAARITGVVLGGVAIPAAYWVFSSIGANVSETVMTKNDHTLVTHGPYRWIRHPLYALGITLFAAVGLMAANWFIIGCAGAALAGIRLAVIPREEAALLVKFGDDYHRYMETTGALLPRIG